MKERPQAPLTWARNLRWSIIAPVALIVTVVALALWLDVATGGDAKPPPLLGELRSPVRGTFVPLTATPPGPTATPEGVSTPGPAPTVPSTVAGTPEERDAQRRADLLVIINGLNELRERDGEYPFTNNNIQSLCVYEDVDVGCDLEDVLGSEPPEDPLGEPAKNGYWYQSDGETAKVYVSFEGAIDDAERCDTDYIDFQDNENMICPTIP